MAEPTCGILAPHDRHPIVGNFPLEAECLGVPNLAEPAAPAGLAVEVGADTGDGHRYVRLLLNGRGLAWLGPQPQSVIDALKASITPEPAAQQPLSRVDASLLTAAAAIRHLPGHWTLADDRVAAEVVARVRADTFRFFAAEMRTLADQAPEGEPARWPWTAYALAAVKAEERAGKGFPSDDTDRTPDVGTPDHPAAARDAQ
jgi:hypothetical protein